MTEVMGLRERKKLETARRIVRTAIALFVERGFDNVSVQEIADAADVSKMTVFNYFGTKEDLAFRPMEDHFGDAARAVRERKPDESPVDAVRRQFLELVETRDPSVGLANEVFVRQLRELVLGTPALRDRVFLAAQKGTRDLAAHLAEETGDLMLATIAAAMISAARNALIEEHWRRADAGDHVDTIVADAPERTARAFALVEQGLGDYARKAH
ncbi:TetR/AcrR family transcriptional regulator [Streptomyces prunicolor]|uniref:TetR family transcriptional regulator n=1 Tax=Streptomyces prunicolor TaxID=67348 RepID=A0ABU4FES1_9ACTN|nr:TetR family transcriptional regulator [Streptomyces prunicolor]MDV7219089.1 TetR family transcriptional regulator [Streptomyces prunicolor]